MRTRYATTPSGRVSGKGQEVQVPPHTGQGRVQLVAPGAKAGGCSAIKPSPARTRGAWGEATGKEDRADPGRTCTRVFRTGGRRNGAGTTQASASRDARVPAWVFKGAQGPGVASMDPPAYLERGASPGGPGRAPPQSSPKTVGISAWVRPSAHHRRTYVTH
jgi:hypothetical protein